MRLVRWILLLSLPSVVVALAVFGYIEQLILWSQPECVGCDFSLAVVDVAGGRAGNNALQIAFWYMMAAQFQRPFLNPLGLVGLLPGCAALGCPIASALPPPYHDFGLGRPPLFNTTITPYMFAFKYYVPNRDYFRRHVFAPDPRPPRNDLVVHVRLDDVFGGHPDYTLCPLSYYAAALRHDHSRARSVAVIGHPQDVEQHEVLSAVAALTTVLLPAAVVRVFSRDSIDDDFRLLIGADRVIASTGTFWVWPALMSATLTTAHMPGFRDDAPMYPYLGLDESDEVVRGEENVTIVRYATDASPLKIHVHPLAFRDKMTREDWRARFYDV